VVSAGPTSDRRISNAKCRRFWTVNWLRFAKGSTQWLALISLHLINCYATEEYNS